MSNELSADEARQIQKDATAALKKIFTKHAGRDRASIMFFLLHNSPRITAFVLRMRRAVEASFRSVF
jgi:hypothetical protein